MQSQLIVIPAAFLFLAAFVLSFISSAFAATLMTRQKPVGGGEAA
jgi:hypothetical protein